jgi:hypothetical protein
VGVRVSVSPTGVPWILTAAGLVVAASGDGC